MVDFNILREESVEVFMQLIPIAFAGIFSKKTNRKVIWPPLSNNYLSGMVAKLPGIHWQKSCPLIIQRQLSDVCTIVEAIFLWTEYEFDIKKPGNLGHLVEDVALNRYKRKFPTYYIKAEGEVDIAFFKKNISA